MTTTEQVAHPCNTNRCDECGAVRGHREHETDWYEETHEFVEHTHVRKCDAAFWELMGWEEWFPSNPEWDGYWRSPDRPKGPPRTIPPILSAPETETSWLAMRDVLAFARAQDISFEINHVEWPLMTVQMWLPGVTGSVADVSIPTVDHLPRAVAEAIQQAIGGGS